MSRAPVIRRPGSDDLNFNHKFLYQLVRRSGPVSRADLMRQSGLTFPSVSRIAAELIAAGMLREGATRRGGMGKPPVGLAVDSEHSYSIGVYIDGDGATVSLVNALGESFKDFSFPTASLSKGIDSALNESGFTSDKLIGVCLTTPSEPVGQEDLGRLSSDLGMNVFSEPAIAASVRAERYFGSAGELSCFLYFDAQSLEFGAMVNGTVLAQPGTLAALLGVQQGKASSNNDVLAGALKGAAVLLQAEALIVGGLSAEDLETLSRSFTDLPVVPASSQAGDPALAAATVPLYKALSV